MRSCEHCGNPLPVGAHPLKRFCNDRCRKKGVSKVVPIRTDDEIEIEMAVKTSTRAALEVAGRVDTPAGQAALALAGRLDLGADDTGSSLASVAKEFRATLAEALAGAAAKPDALDGLKDELRDRREQKARAGS